LKGIPQERYAREFRYEAVRLLTEKKPSSPEVDRRVSLPPSTLAYWVKAYKAGKLGEISDTRKPLTAVEMELARTKKKLVEVKMERDIFRKQSRTLRGSRCTVRGDQSDAAPLPHTTPEPNSGGLNQRFLRLDSAAALSVGKGRNMTGSNTPGNTLVEPGNLWGR
jgi:transposase